MGNKPKMIAAAVSALQPVDPGVTDTGTLRGDLLSMLGQLTLGADDEIARPMITSRLADQLTSRLSSSDLKAIGGTDSLTPALVNSLPERLHDAVVTAYQQALTRCSDTWCRSSSSA
ncbi:hypothetical protein [Streptomyces sp. NPDC058086]|uniref:hypothetical protein n=1 Tax=Streptomyces sp. NPDC058086 TaxID=3346334 RepID=UPI0036E0DC3A